jgi:hypothetical protein
MIMDGRTNDIKRAALEARDFDRPKILFDPAAQPVVPVPDRSGEQRLAYRPLLPVSFLRQATCETAPHCDFAGLGLMLVLAALQQ